MSNTRQPNKTSDWMRICLYIKNLQVYEHVSIKVNKMLIRLLINWSGGSCVPVKNKKILVINWQWHRRKEKFVFGVRGVLWRIHCWMRQYWLYKKGTRMGIPGLNVHLQFSHLEKLPKCSLKLTFSNRIIHHVIREICIL